MKKNIKRSIREKYSRRLRDLYYTLEQYLIYADYRLDQSLGGYIWKRSEIEEIIKRSKSLLEIVPESAIPEIDYEKIFDLEFNQSDLIIETAKDFVNNLSDTEWKVVRQHKDSLCI